MNIEEARDNYEAMKDLLKQAMKDLLEQRRRSPSLMIHRQYLCRQESMDGQILFSGNFTGLAAAAAGAVSPIKPITAEGMTYTKLVEKWQDHPDFQGEENDVDYTYFHVASETRGEDTLSIECGTWGERASGQQGLGNAQGRHSLHVREPLLPKERRRPNRDRDGRNAP